MGHHILSSLWSSLDAKQRKSDVANPISLSNIIAATITYDDNFGSSGGANPERQYFIELRTQETFAFPTQVTNALGQSGYTQYDYYLGRAVDQKDFNGVIASGYYNDLLDRPTQMIRAANLTSDPNHSQISFSYDDTGHKITTTRHLTRSNHNVLKNEMY